MRTPSWIHQLPRIISDLQAQPAYSRRDVQAIFGIGKSAAVDLMRVAGVIPGPVPTVSRAALLAYVENCPASQEMARRRKLAGMLKAAEEDLKLRAVPLPVSPGDEWTLLRDLPGITIEEGVLRVEFDSFEDLLQQLHRLSKAMGNDEKEFRRRIGEPDQMPMAQKVSRDDFEGLLRLATPEEKARILGDSPTGKLHEHA